MRAEERTDLAGFLGRVRAALARGRAPVAWQDAEAGPADWSRPAAEVRADALRRWQVLLPRFAAEVEAVGGTVHRAIPAEVPAQVATIARERGLSRVASWGESILELPGLLAGLRREGLAVAEEGSVPGAAVAPAGNEERYGGADWAEIGLTGVDAAVADSGTLVLLSGAGKGRLVSCLPAVHVALLRPGQLVASLPEIGILLEHLHQGSPQDGPSAVAFITGPSRTADIELSLTRGVHGPKEVHVIALG